MKQKLSIICLLFISFIIYSCCKEKIYNTSINDLKYLHQNDTNSFDNKMLIHYRLVWENQLVAGMDIINEVNAHGLGSGAFKCDNKTYKPITDQVTEIAFTCDKNLLGYKSGDDLKSSSDANIESNETKSMLNLVSTINNMQNKYSLISLYTSIPDSILEKDDFYTFTLKIKTASGKEFVAVTKPIYWKK